MRLRCLELSIVVMCLALFGCGNDAADLVSTQTGANVQTEDLHVGTGLFPVQGQRVTISYVGTLVDGTKFDSTIDRGQDFQFRLGAGEVIRGLELGITNMKIGGHRKITIPPELGYGAQGSPPTIPANATLIFDVWLISAS